MNRPQITIVFQNSPLAEEWQAPQQAQPVGRRISIPLRFRPKRQTPKRQRRRRIWALLGRSGLPRLREIRGLVPGFHGLNVLFYRGANAFVGRGAFAERFGGIAEGD